MKYDMSIIIPAYNCAGTISECLDSIFHQKNADAHETIVVDDGSTDRTVDIVCELMPRHPNLRLIAQGNAGVSAARNIGIDAAHGEYVTFVDADDMVGLDMARMMEMICVKYKQPNIGNLMSAIGTMERNKHTPVFEDMYFQRMLNVAQTYDADIAFGGKITLYNDRDTARINGYNNIRVGGDVAAKDVFLRHAGARESANFALYRRDMLNKTGLRFMRGMQLDEDILFCMQAILRANNIATVPNATYLYRRHPESLSNISEKDTGIQKYRMAYVQEFSVLLSELGTMPGYEQIYNHWLKEFAAYGQDTICIPGYLNEAFPLMCDGCPDATCDGCLYNDIINWKIKCNLAKYMPGYTR